MVTPFPPGNPFHDCPDRNILVAAADLQCILLLVGDSIISDHSVRLRNGQDPGFAVYDLSPVPDNMVVTVPPTDCPKTVSDLLSFSIFVSCTASIFMFIPTLSFKTSGL